MSLAIILLLVIAFGRCSSEIYVVAATQRIWRRVFRTRDRKKGKEIWSSGATCLYPRSWGMKILFAPVSIARIVPPGTHYFVPLSAKGARPYPRRALFFTRKTPLRRNSARWITPTPLRPPPSVSLKSANVANVDESRAARDTGSKRITRWECWRKSETVTSVLTFSRINDKATCPGPNSDSCTFQVVT